MNNLGRSRVPTRLYRQCRAAGTPFRLHTVTAPVTGSDNARSSVAVSRGSVPAVGSQFVLHLLGHTAFRSNSMQWTPAPRARSGRLHQQVGAHLGQAGHVDLAAPSGDDRLHSLPGEAAPPAGSHRRCAVLLVLPVPAVQVGPVAAADNRGQHPAHVGRPPHPQLRQVVPPVVHRHQAGVNEPLQVAG